jgi:hypothetical protein
VRLLAPGITLFVVLLIGSIVVRSLPIFLAMGLLFYGFAVIPITLILAIAALSCFYGRRHWLSGLSILCTVPLVFAVGFFPHPVTSPVGWAANVVRVVYYHDDLQHLYAEARKSGQALPVGVVYTDGFGSLTSGLAYDPSREFALQPKQRSRAWNDGPGATEIGINSVEVHPIYGSYYQWFHP